MKARLLGSLTIGVLVAIALVTFADKYRRAALVASAAKSGGRETVTSILADGFVGTTLIAAVVVFVFATVLAGGGAVVTGGVRTASSGAGPARTRGDDLRRACR